MNFHSHEDMQRRWFIEPKQNPVLKVDVETHAFLGEDNHLSMIPEESMEPESIKNEYKAEPEDEPKEEPDDEPKEEPDDEPKEEPTEPEDQEIEPKPSMPTRPEPVRRGQTPKTGVTKKGKTAKKTESKVEIRGTSMNTVFKKESEPFTQSISLNDPVTESVDEPVTESKTDKLKLKVPKLKTKPGTKPESKPSTKSKTKSETNQ
jgi:hypothetical protein